MSTWQPIETGTPRTFVEVLVINRHNEIFVAFVDKSGEWRWSSHDDGWCIPTHWMPLPPPPEATP